MSCHLNHKLPWTLLDNNIRIVAKHVANDTDPIQYRAEIVDRKPVLHFARVLFTQLNEFAATDKSIEEDVSESIDLETWDGGQFHGAGGHLGVISSTLTAYVLLNLLMADYNNYQRSSNLRNGHCRIVVAITMVVIQNGLHTEPSNCLNWIRKMSVKHWHSNH